MTREHQPRRQSSKHTVEIAMALGTVTGAFLVSDHVGAEQPLPAGIETLSHQAHSEVIGCNVSFVSVMTESPSTPTAPTPPESIIATHIVADGDTLMNMARACLGVTPEQTAADPRLAQAVGMLVKDIVVRNPNVDPNNLTLETPITISVSEATHLKHDLGLTHASTPPEQAAQPTVPSTKPEQPTPTEQLQAPYEIRIIASDAEVDVRALQASVGPDQAALLIWDADSQEVARQVGEFIAKRKLKIIGASPIVVYAIARANHDRMPPSVQQGMVRFENTLVELATGKTPQEVQEAQDARLAQAEYANRLALNNEKTRIAQEVYGTGAHTTYDGYVLDPRGSFYLSEFGTFVQITDELTRSLVLPENALTENDLSNFQEGYRLHSVAEDEVPMGILRARLEELQARGELYRLSDTPHDPTTAITPELFDRILVRETREMIAIWGGDPQVLRPGVALPMPGKYFPADEQPEYAKRVIIHNQSAGIEGQPEQLMQTASVVEFLTRVQEQFPGLQGEEMAQLAIILKQHPDVNLADLHTTEQVRGVIQQYLPSVNHGPTAGGEEENPVAAAVYADEGIRAIIQNDPMNQGIVAFLVNGLLSEGHVDAVVIASEVRAQYMTQYRYHLGRAVSMDRADAIKYLEFHTKVDTAAATALYDKMTAGGADPATLGSDVLDAIKKKAATHPSNGVNMTENMGPSGGGPEDEMARIRSQIIDPAARMYMELFPEQTRALLESHTQSSIHEIQAMLYSAYQSEVETQLQLDANANEQDLITRLQGLTNVSIDPYRQYLINNSHDANIMVNYLADVIPAYAQIAPQATQSKDLLARLKPEVFLENDLTNDLNSQEVVRIAFTMVEDEITVMTQHMQRGLPPPAEVQETYATLADLMGKTILDNMLQLAYAQDASHKQSLDIITTGASRYKQRVEGTLPEGIRSTLTPEQAYQVIESWNTDPVARMYMEAHHDEAAALIYESLAQQNHDMQTIVNSIVTQAAATLRTELASAPTEAERLAAIQRQAPFDISPFQSELLQTSEQGRITETLETLALDAADYNQIRAHVEENEEALARIDIATYDERMSSSLSRPEAIQQIYHIIEHRIREGVVDLTAFGQITDLTTAATYQNIQRLWGARPLQDWVLSMEQDGIDMHSSAEIVDMIDIAYTTFLDNKELRTRRPRLTDSPAAANESAPYEAPAPDDTDMNRADDAGAGSETAGSGNGVEVQGGDTMTQPLVEPDRRGDNAVEVPPSGYTNPSDYNPEGTPITPEGQAAMSEPMVTPDMSQAMAISDGPITTGSAPATLPDGSASLSDAMRKSQGETASQPPLTMDEIMKIISEDGPAIEAYIQSERGKFGPDSLVLQTQLHEFIQTHPDEVHRIIARHMPQEATDTYWVWEEIDPATRDAIIKALLATAAAAAAAGAAMGNTLSGGGA